MSECLGLHHALFLGLITWRYAIMPSGYCNFHIYPYMLTDTQRTLDRQYRRCLFNVQNDKHQFLTMRSVNRTSLLFQNATIPTKKDVLRTHDLFLDFENDYPILLICHQFREDKKSNMSQGALVPLLVLVLSSVPISSYCSFYVCNCFSVEEHRKRMVMKGRIKHMFSYRINILSFIY